MNPEPSLVMASKREKVLIPRINERPWEVRLKPGQIPGPMMKTLSSGTGGALSSDPDLIMNTLLTNGAPRWLDPELVYHPCVEEVFWLTGPSSLADRYYQPGCYMYRPPGILHGPAYNPSDMGSAKVQRFAAAGGLMRYDGTEYPKVDSQPVTDEYKDWPVRWVEFLDWTKLPWIENTSGPWEEASHKWLSRNRVTGGGTILIQLPAGWSGKGSLAQGNVEEFVVSGTVTMGELEFERWGYACRPPGDAAGAYTSREGAMLLCFWDKDELQ